MGDQIMNATVAHGAQKLSIDIASWTSGVYIIQLITNKRVVSQSFIKD